jgi:hypothetical protein
MHQKLKSKIIRKNKDKKIKKNKIVKNPLTWKQWLFVFFLSIFIMITLYIFLCSHFVRLQNINVIGTERLDSSQVLNMIENLLEGELFACIKKDNYFFVNEKKIIENILADKRVKSVEIEKKFPQTLNVNIIEYGTIAIWCSEKQQINCYILNENGVAIAPINMTDDIVLQNKYFVIVGEEQLETILNEEVIFSDDLKKIKILGEELVYVLDVVIKQPYFFASRGSHEVKLETDEGWYIILDVTQDAQEILNIAKLFVKNIELPSTRSDLEYIDIRFPEKIFYKMKDGVEQIEENEESDRENGESKIQDEQNEKVEDVKKS